MKKCPFCAEEIQDEAIICRYCGKELKPNVWRYLTIVFHFRSMAEGGWLWAEETPAALASQHFWNSWSSFANDMDGKMISGGWEIADPRGPACIELKADRSTTFMVLGVLSALGGGEAGNPWKWWPGSLTLRWKRPAEVPAEETMNFWINPKVHKWERMEQEPNGQWNIWRVPADCDPYDPNDDNRWDKIPI